MATSACPCSPRDHGVGRLRRQLHQPARVLRSHGVGLRRCQRHRGGPVREDNLYRAGRIVRGGKWRGERFSADSKRRWLAFYSKRKFRDTTLPFFLENRQHTC